MDERTRAYLRGRFRDFYRRVPPAPPPAAATREWGYIPWTAGGTTMVRHQALTDLGDLGSFLAEYRPRHVYFSAGRYRAPGADSMGAKDWLGSDLIFDLDADHLPEVTPSEDSYPAMLAACKDALWRLLDHLHDDFGFSDTAVVFSGGRGYHVHVRDESVRGLDRDARRDIVDYIRGIGVTFDGVVATEPVAGIGRKTPTEKRSLDPTGGWSRRAHRAIVSYVDDLLAMEATTALEALQEFEGIGPGKAEKALNAATRNYDQIAAGNIDIHPAFFELARRLFDRALAEESAAIDEPVTTDIHRLIRLPGSLHGGTGLVVTPVPVDALSAFDPLVDAVPEPFVGHEVTVRCEGGPSVTLRGETFTVPAGITSLPEYVAVFLMARGRARKEKE